MSGRKNLAVLGSDGTVGGPGGSGLTPSVVNISSPATFTASASKVLDLTVPTSSGHSFEAFYTGDTGLQKGCTGLVLRRDAAVYSHGIAL